LVTRRTVFAFTVLADFVLLTVLFKALGIIQILHLNVAQIGMRCGDSKARRSRYCGTIRGDTSHTYDALLTTAVKKSEASDKATFSPLGPLAGIHQLTDTLSKGHGNAAHP